MQFPELTYAQAGDSWPKRWVIRGIEHLSGRNFFAPLYKEWREEVVPKGGAVMAPVLDLIGVNLALSGAAWPPQLDSDSPLVIVANHPFGIVDGFCALSLAERLGRPFRVLINKDLLKVPEIRPYSLPVDFDDTKQSVVNNVRMRREALRLLKEGTTIIIFPAGGVATSPTPWGRAVDLPWKLFAARMILEARAQVLPLYFEGQNSALFHAVSRVSLTLRLSLIIREFRMHVGSTVQVRVGDVLPVDALRSFDRRSLIDLLYDKVHSMSGFSAAEILARVDRLPGYLVGNGVGKGKSN